jgi:hypothetical protein
MASAPEGAVWRLTKIKGDTGPVFQSIIECMTSMSNQMIMLSGRPGRKVCQVVAMVEETHKDYPAFE